MFKQINVLGFYALKNNRNLKNEIVWYTAVIGKDSNRALELARRGSKI